MVRLTRDQILHGAVELKREPILIPQWGGTFYVRELTGTEYDAWEAAIVQQRENARAVTVVHTLVDEHGEFVFTVEDVEAVGKLPAGIIARIANKARKLNKLGRDDIEDEKGKSEPETVDNSSST